MFCSWVCTFAILVGFCFPWWAFSNGSKQWFGCPERVLLLVDLWHRKQAFAQAALWPGGPGTGKGLGLEAVPHLAGGLEGAQSSLLASGVLIAGPVPAADHRLRGEAVHVCDHPRIRPLHPPPSCSLQDPSPQLLLFLAQPSLSLDPSLEVVGWRGDCEGCV